MTECKFIIDDSNFDQHKGDSKLCGTRPRRIAYGAHPLFKTSTKTIPRVEWPDRIADMKRRKARNRDLWASTPIGVLDQDQISYCHAFSAALAAMMLRAVMGLPYVELSASSIGGPVTGWRNEGAVIEDDLMQMIHGGVASTLYVPMLTTNVCDCKPGWEADAKLHAVTEWTDLEPRNLDQHVTWLLAGFPVCVGLNYWGHAVTDFDPEDLNPRLHVDNDDRWGILFLNSWTKNWGDGGFGIRAGSKKYADSLYVPRQLTV